MSIYLIYKYNATATFQFPKSDIRDHNILFLTPAFWLISEISPSLKTN
jgi:hypothetical protein